MQGHSVGIIGCGYWGPNLIRNFFEHPGVGRVLVCDRDPGRLDFIQRRYPSIDTCSDLDEFFEDSEIDATVIATPVSTHYPFAKRALETGRHVLIEKPMAQSVAEAEELTRLAKENGRVIMVDHTFLYTAAVNEIRKRIDSGELGDCLYFDSVRINLGLFQHDVNVLWDLAVHDISIMLYLLRQSPLWVQASGIRHFKDQHENIAYLACEMPGNQMGHIHVNWLSPVKVRKIILGGSKRMIVYDDNEVMEKIKVYDAGVELDTPPETIHDILVSYRVGDIFVPKLQNIEALREVAADFIHCIETGDRPRSDGNLGLDVIRILESASQSMKEDGKRNEL